MSGGLVMWLGWILLAMYLPITMSLELIPERAEILDINDKYLRNASLKVRRTGRNSPYYIMLDVTTLDWIGDNTSIQCVFYEYLHNEYKRSFVEININLCDVWNKQPWRSLLGVVFEAQGITCPAPPGTYKIKNATPQMKNFPYVWPFEKTMIEYSGVMLPSKDRLFSARVYGTFKKDIRKGKF